MKYYLIGYKDSEKKIGYFRYAGTEKSAITKARRMAKYCYDVEIRQYTNVGYRLIEWRP